LVIRNINYNTQDFSHLNKVIAYIDEDYSEKEANILKTKVVGIADMVEGVTLITKDQTLKEEKEKYQEQYPHMFDVLDEDENPYRHSLEITYIDGIEPDDLRTELEKIDGIEHVVAYQDIANSVSQLKDIVGRVFGTFILILFVITVFVIILTIRFVVVSHRDEVKTMRYVGATMRFIAMPYILEGLLIGLLSSVVAYFAQGFLYGYIEGAMSGALTAMPYADVSTILLIGFVVIGSVTGIIGSIISLFRYLRV
jgi:cell division transport system permease protein